MNWRNWIVAVIYLAGFVLLVVTWNLRATAFAE